MKNLFFQKCFHSLYITYFGTGAINAAGGSTISASVLHDINIASVTKALTRMAAIKLLEQKGISLDDNIGSWLPDYWQKIRRKAPSNSANCSPTAPASRSHPPPGIRSKPLSPGHSTERKPTPMPMLTSLCSAHCCRCEKCL
ncbi:MAG: hypothetical protein DYG98_10495 [Haliscomenobacteraceae bacterium CHB4]|nr:hypothetical protein [Haliscomenobacteraceae bacterium CHB4]